MFIAGHGCKKKDSIQKHSLLKLLRAEPRPLASFKLHLDDSLQVGIPIVPSQLKYEDENQPSHVPISLPGHHPLAAHHLAHHLAQLVPLQLAPAF